MNLGEAWKKVKEKVLAPNPKDKPISFSAEQTLEDLEKRQKKIKEQVGS